MKNTIKLFVPPIMLSIYRRLKKQYGLSGNYNSWEEACKFAVGYDDEKILEKVKSATLKVISGEAVFERDSVCFYKEDYNFQMLAALFYVASSCENKLNVIDFGGALGSTYWQNKKLFSNLKKLSWQVVEQKHFVECGKKYIADDILKFQEKIESCWGGDCLVLSSSLQYFDKPHQYLEKFLELNIPYIIVDKTPFWSKKDRIALQEVSPEIYSASIPAWIFNEEEFFTMMSKKYEVIFKWDNKKDTMPLLDEGNVYYSGVLLKLKD